MDDACPGRGGASYGAPARGGGHGGTPGGSHGSGGGGAPSGVNTKVNGESTVNSADCDRRRPVEPLRKSWHCKAEIESELGEYCRA